MDDHESAIMMLALSALLGVITLIGWCIELWQRHAWIRWATQPLVDPADKGDGPESVQHGLRDADMDLAAATDQAMSLSLRQCELAVQDLIAIGSAEEKPGQNDRPLVDSADKGDGLESRLWIFDPVSSRAAEREQERNAPSLSWDDGKLGVLQAAWFAHRWFCWIEAAARNSLGRAWSELKTYVDVLTGDALRQSNARLLALVLAILVGVIGTLVILAVWLSPTPEQNQVARNGQGKQGTQQSTPAGDASPSLLGQYGEYEQSASTPVPEQSASTPAPEQSASTPVPERSTSTPAPEQSRGWIAEVKKSRAICESADDYVQIQRMALRPSRKAMRKAAEFVKRKCQIIMFKPGNHANVERTETFSINRTRSITLACVVIKDGPCAWTDASELVRIPEEAPSSRPEE